MAMEERKCQMSWSSKKSSRMQSRLCSRDSAGVFYAGQGELSPCPPRCHPLPHTQPPTCQVLSPWKKKKRAKPQTTEVPIMQSRGMSLMRSPLRSWRRGWGHHAGGTQQPWWAASGRAPPKRPPPVPSPHGLRSHLHDDVEGEVEEQVADADGQQVGSKVIGVDNEAVGSTGEAGTGSGVSSACGVPPRALLSPRTCWQLPQGMGRCRGLLRCRGCRGRAQPTAATSWVSSALGAGPGPGGEQGRGSSGDGGAWVWRKQRGGPALHSQRPVDDVPHDQEHHSVLPRERRRGEERAWGAPGQARGGSVACQVSAQPQAGGQQARGQRRPFPSRHSPRTWARCTAGRSPCTARAGSCAGCPSLWGQGR